MSTLNKFIIFQCDTCKRLKELKIISNRLDPIRCIITNKCQGKLTRIGESSTKKFLLTPPRAGLKDFIPRGTVISSAPIISTIPDISLSTGTGILTIAVLTRTELSGSQPTGTHSFSVLGIDNTPIVISSPIPDNAMMSSNVKIQLNLFPISSSILQSISYNYLRSGSVYSISGADSSPASNNLRFSSSNKIKIFVNGIELNPSAYKIDILRQSITFTPALYELNNVIDVTVYNDLKINVNPNDIISLSFRALDPATNYTILSSNSWGNYNSIDIPNVGTRFLMHCSDLSALVNNTSYGVDNVQIIIEDQFIPVGSLTIGSYYEIATIGSSSFTNVGSSNNSIGTIFKATGVGTGNGTVKIINTNIVSAGSFTKGSIYTIETIGNTDFTAIGSIINKVGLQFIAQGPGSGTGTAVTISPLSQVLPSEVNFLLAADPYTFKDKELNAYLNGISFDSTFTFKYHPDLISGVYELTVSQDRFKQLLNPIIPSNQFQPSIFATQPTLGAVIAAPNINHMYIIGPT